MPYISFVCNLFTLILYFRTQCFCFDLKKFFRNSSRNHENFKRETLSTQVINLCGLMKVFYISDISGWSLDYDCGKKNLEERNYILGYVTCK